MSNDPLAELRTALVDAIANHIGCPLNAVELAVADATADWTATRKDFPHRDQHPLEEVHWGHQIIVTLPFVPETDDERTDREARWAADHWAAQAYLYSWDPQDPGYDHDDAIGPPPERISVRGLLQQGLWWRSRATKDPDDRTTQATRLADMEHSHRLNLLGFLRKRAPGYKRREDWYYASIPGPNGDMSSDAFEAECDRQWETPAAEWIEDQPLIQALVYWTTPYAESPLTWRPMDEAPSGINVLVRWRTASTTGESLARFSGFDRKWYAVGEDALPLDGSPLEWRELRDDEKPSPSPECEHEGFEEQDCETCGSQFYPCRHGGTRDSDYCSACEQE